MKRSHTGMISTLALGGLMVLGAPYAWSQTSGGTSSDAPGRGSQMQNKSDAPRGGQSMQRGAAPSGARGQRMSHENIKSAQEALKAKGFDPGEADGMMGPKTSQALREFQKSNNLQATGRLDQKTASALGVEAGAMGGSSSSMGSSNTDASTDGAKSRPTAKETTGRQMESGSPSSSPKEKTGADVPTKGFGPGGKAQ